MAGVTLPIFGSTPAAAVALPLGVVEKLEMIRELADTAHRQIPLVEERQNTNSERADAQRRLDRLLAHPHDTGAGVGGGFAMHPESPQVLAQQKLLATLTATAKRLEDRYQRAREFWLPRARTRRECETWLKNLPLGTTIQDYAGPEPKPNTGETTLDAVARLARRARELRADAHRVESAPLPLSHARSRLVEIIERLAQPPNVSALIEHGEIWWPMRSVQSQVLNANRPIAFAEMPDVLATLGWAIKETLIKQLDGLLAEEADDASALSIPVRRHSGRLDMPHYYFYVRRGQITVLDHEGIELADTADAKVEAAQRAKQVVNGEATNGASMNEASARRGGIIVADDNWQTLFEDPFG